MQPGLAEIQQFMQQVVETIAATIGVEVMVFDTDLNIIAGTGETKVEVGDRYNVGSLSGQLFSVKQPLIAHSPGKSRECLNCKRYGTCPHHVVLAYPIMIEKEIIGSFCLVATSEEQRQRVLANEDALMGFLYRMCLLISNTVSERKIRNRIRPPVKAVR